MSTRLGRGILQSLRARVDADVRELVHQNKTLRRARYVWVRRLLQNWLVGRPGAAVMSAYGVAMIGLIVIERLAHRFLPCLYQGVTNEDFPKDAAGFFLSAQIGILAVLTVAIGVVTLLTQKDDGSAVNTDVRLYYFESFSYEIATSGVLLSCAIVLQLFLPLQPVISYLISDEVVPHFQICVTGIHALWLVLNLFLFLHFIGTTLRFVDTPSRSRLRKQYSANEIIPRDVGRRLLATYYIGAPGLILGEDDLSKGPRVAFGMGLISGEESIVEVSRSFRAPSRLHDVWLLPLAVALRSWRKRTRSKGSPQSRMGQTYWAGDLAVMTDFKMVHDEKLDLVLRDGGVALNRFERALLRLSLRFASVGQRDKSLPTPTEFIEQLVSKLVAQIEAGAPNGFEDTLKEVVDFHAFVLAAQNARDERGTIINLAQVRDGMFLQPDFDWLREYRRAFTSATNKMTTDGSFIQGMSGLVVRLWPPDPADFPSSILTNILELGRFEVSVFEAWITKRAVVAAPEAGAATDLAGSDFGAYEEALVHFVASWETLAQVIISSFDIRKTAGRDNAAYWRANAQSWPSLQTHLRNAAYFLAASVWNEDLAGSNHFQVSNGVQSGPPIGIQKGPLRRGLPGSRRREGVARPEA